MARFYGRFAAAYGTCWLVMLLAALLTQRNVNTGMFGLIGFPLISLVYAVIRPFIIPERSYSMRSLQERISQLEREHQSRAGI